MATKKNHSIARGTYLEGPSHSQGGIRVINKSDPASNLEVEGGEVVINKKSVASRKLKEFEGRKLTNRQILSEINTEDNNGIPLEKGGMICCTGKKYQYGGETLSDYDIAKKISQEHQPRSILPKKTSDNLKKKLPLIVENVPAVKAAPENPLVREALGVKPEGNKFVIYSKLTGEKLPQSDNSFDSYEQADAAIAIASKAAFMRGGTMVSKYDTFKDCGCQHSMAAGGSIATDDQLIADFKKIGKKDSFLLTLYEGREDEMIKFVQDQATGMDSTRTSVQPFGSGLTAYDHIVQTIGDKDLVLRAVMAIPQDKKDMIIKAWKGHIIPAELRQAVKTKTMQDGGEINSIKQELQTGYTLDRRKRDYVDLPSFAIFSGMMARGGTIQFKKGGSFKPAKEYANAFELNKAIEALLDSKTDNESFTSEEKEFISYYSGYGGLEKYGAEGKGLLYEYYTPGLITQKMWGLVYSHGFSGGDVLEPAAGIGEFVKYAPDQSKVDAFEINKYSARILKILYPQSNVSNTYFEEIFIKNRNTIKNKVSGLKKYDLVIGNPPYGEFAGKYAGMGERDYTRAANYIDYFIFRGLDLLKPAGLLCFIVGAEVASGGKPFLQQQMNKCKKEISEKANLLDAYRLPNGIFERTDVLTDIIVLQKK